LPNSNGTYDGKINAGTGLSVDVSPFEGIVGGRFHRLEEDAGVNKTVTLNPNKATIICAKLNPDELNVNPVLDKQYGVFPDPNGTSVARYIFNQSNPLDTSGTNAHITTTSNCTSVSGWIDTALQGNGTSSYLSTNNSIGVSGSSSRTEIILYTPLTVSGSTIRYIKIYGNYHLYTEGARLKVREQSNICDTGYDVEANKKYLIFVRYNGTVLDVFVNGNKVYTLSTTFNTTAGQIYFLRNSTAANYNAAIIDYYDLKAVALTDAEIGAIFNRLIFPCRYTNNGVEKNIVTDALPANSIALGFVKTDSTNVIIIDDSNFRYMRNEGIGKRDGNKGSAFLGWQSVVLGSEYVFENVLNTQNIKIQIFYKKYLTDYPVSIITRNDLSYGICIHSITNEKIKIITGAADIILLGNSYTGSAETTGYYGLYVEAW
jgi:hypothetical protein